MKRALLVGLFLAICAGCNSEPAVPATGMPGMTAAMPMTAAAPATAEPDPTPEELPVPEDFEDEASAAVQEQNFRAELDRIAREIEATP